MQCIARTQITLKNGNGTIEVNCQKCNFCMSNRRKDWSFRCEVELDHSMTATFLTLTYDSDNVPIDVDEKGEAYYALDKKDAMLFHKTIKQFQGRQLIKLKRKLKLNKEAYAQLKKRWRIRYITVGEYGSNTNRPHYHSIMFNLHPNTVEAMSHGKVWGKGFVKFGEVNSKTINYVCKYMVDREETVNGRVRPFMFMSKNPGIGSGYITREAKKFHGNYGERLRYYVVNSQGKKQAMPRYYKDKIFTKLEKQIAGIAATEQSLDQYHKEIEMLEYQNYRDPHKEMEDRRNFQYAMIRVKSKALNTF